MVSPVSIHLDSHSSIRQQQQQQQQQQDMVVPGELQEALLQSIIDHVNCEPQIDSQSDQGELSIQSSSIASVISNYRTPSSASSVGNSPSLHARSTAINNQPNELLQSSIPLFTLDFPERMSEQVIKEIDEQARDENAEVVSSGEEKLLMITKEEQEQEQEDNTILPPVTLLCFAQVMTTLEKMNWSSMELVEVDVDYAARSIRIISAVNELDLSLPIRQVCDVHIVENTEKEQYLCLKVCRID